MKIEVDKAILDDLDIRATTYGLCLSAMVRKHGTFNKHTKQYEYFITLEMLQAVGETQLFTTNEVNPKTKKPHTKVHISLPAGENGSG